MSVTNIKTSLLTALNAMGSLKIAFPYETSDSDGKYPFACLTLKGGTGQFADTARNLRKHSFWIRVYQEQSKEGQGVQQAETIAVNVLDELIAHLDLNMTLSGNCKYTKPVSYTTTYQRRELTVRILEVQVDAYEIQAAAIY